jgi:hypothetical protein
VAADTTAIVMLLSQPFAVLGVHPSDKNDRINRAFETAITKAHEKSPLSSLQIQLYY